MEEHKEHHIIGYKTYLYILLTLVVLTFISIGVTSIELGPLTVTVALLLASVKTVFVLLYFMHLKFDEKIYIIMVAGVMVIFVAVILITFIDYIYR